MPTDLIPPEWRDWIATNRASGCTEESMLSAMREAGIGAVVAAAWLGVPVPVTPVATLEAQPSTAARAAAGDVYRCEPSRLAAGNSIELSDRTVRIALRLQQPDIVVLDGLLSEAECAGMIAYAQDRMEPSTVVDPASGDHTRIALRSSEGAMFQRGETPLVKRIEQRIAELLSVPEENGEGLQVLHYHGGGEYRPHYDYFPPHNPGSALHLKRGGQRIATLIMYLNDVAEGGATTFPSLSLSVTPKRGSAVYFAYCNATGQLDPATLHGGAPVLAGEKWIATKWLRQGRFG